MFTGLTALENTDWSRLHHAYGRATDTPDYLRALLREDADSRNQAMEHLWSAVIHQGTPWTCTGPAALVVAGLLSDPRIDRGHPVRVNLISFLVEVAMAATMEDVDLRTLEQEAAYDLEPLIDANDEEALYGDGEASSAFMARSVLGCIRAAPVLLKVMLEGLENPDPQMRANAAMGAVALCKTECLRERMPEVQEKLMTLAQAAQDTDERSAHVLALGDSGVSPSLFLEDLSPPVRLCAALAPGLESDPIALDELIGALETGKIDGWFVERPPQFSMCPRFSAIARVVEQVKEFGRLVNAAIATVALSSKYTVDQDWGPFLAMAFADGSGTVKTDSQRRFLEALVNRTELWDQRFGNAQKWFKKAGLPFDRGECVRRLKRNPGT